MKKLRKGFIVSLALSMVLSVVNITAVKAAGGVEVVKNGNTVVIGNEDITREFSTANNKLQTVVIENNRTDGKSTLLVPAEGTEEFVIGLLPNAFPAIDRTGWSADADSYQTNVYQVGRKQFDQPVW